jgi:hypothetical protein
MRKHLTIAVTGVLAALLLAIPAAATTARDANNDNLPDRWEKRHDLSLNVNQAPRDQDQDGLRNKGEYKHGTDPRDPDSNNNGEGDEQECHKGEEGGHHGPPPPPPSEELPPVAP